MNFFGILFATFTLGFGLTLAEPKISLGTWTNNTPFNLTVTSEAGQRPLTHYETKNLQLPLAASREGEPGISYQATVQHGLTSFLIDFHYNTSAHTLTASLSASTPLMGRNYWSETKTVDPNAQLTFNGILSGETFEKSRITNW